MIWDHYHIPYRAGHASRVDELEQLKYFFENWLDKHAAENIILVGVTRTEALLKVQGHFFLLY